MSKSTVTIYTGIRLVTMEMTEPNHRTTINNSTSLKLQELLPDTVSNIKVRKDSVQFAIGSGQYCDGNEITKNVTLFCDGTWSIHISGTEINLNSIYISDKYIPTPESIQQVIKTTRLIRLCEGVKLTKTVVVSRYHVLNKWQNDEGECRCLHSVVCSKVVALNALSQTCRKCGKMTFTKKTKTDQENKSRKTEKENVPLTNVTNIMINNNTDENNNDQMPNLNKQITRDEIKALVPDAKDEMVELLFCQVENAAKHPKGRRWSQQIITFCLQWYCKSPKSYESVRESGYLLLPSRSILIQYKTKVKQNVGFDDNIFRWMHEEARRKDLCEEGYMGGLIIDEMAIQADVEITKSGDVIELVGLSDVGEEGNLSNMLRKGKQERTVGTHALQLVFLGVTGFRFPIAHFISDGVQAPELYCLFWEAVDKLQMFGFTTVYTCLDGAQSNRSFLKIHTGPNPTSYRCQSPCTFLDMIFMMDYSHVIKKIRNNIIKSGISKHCTRNLILDSGRTVQWQMFVDCYQWDKSNALQLHRKLTNEHIFPSNQSKMRNHLAEDVLDTEMLNLFIQYQQYLGEKGSILDGVVELLKQTSKLIQIFRDMRPIKYKEDQRLTELSEIGKWFDIWEKNAMKLTSIKAKDRSRRILSHQAHEDIQSCIVGFIELCKTLLTLSNKVHITPGLTNSDVVENTFNQQRSTYNGANTNPSALQYRRSLNSIMLGQNLVSQKGNAGRYNEAAVPYNCQLTRNRKRASDSKPQPNSMKVIRM